MCFIQSQGTLNMWPRCLFALDARIVSDFLLLFVNRWSWHLKLYCVPFSFVVLISNKSKQQSKLSLETVGVLHEADEKAVSHFASR